MSDAKSNPTKVTKMPLQYECGGGNLRAEGIIGWSDAHASWGIEQITFRWADGVRLDNLAAAAESFAEVVVLHAEPYIKTIPLPSDL